MSKLKVRVNGCGKNVDCLGLLKHRNNKYVTKLDEGQGCSTHRFMNNSYIRTIYTV